MPNRTKTASLPDISLDGNWVHRFSASNAEKAVDSLAHWSPESGQATLVKRFDLPMRDICVSYWLRLDNAPANVMLRVNQRDYGKIQTPLEIDVTDEVMLEDNEITFYVADMTSGSFGDIRLIVRPCDDHA